MRHVKSFLTCMLLVVATLSSAQTSKSNTGSTKILFIGNSYTYYNSSPELVKALIQEKFPEEVVETQLISQGGMTLKRHWQENKAVQAIRSGQWDYVVLQEQSKLGMGVTIDNDHYFGQTEMFFEYARKFDAEIKKAGAKTVFFMTWSRKNQPEYQPILTHAYSTMAKELHAILAPVGLVWDQLRTQEQFDLYVRDGSHPSTHGSYLIANTLVATLFEESPMGLSGKISGKKLSRLGEPSLESERLVDISSGDAETIQVASWEIVHALQESGEYPAVQKPKPAFTIPVLPAGEAMSHTSISGRWYGTSAYSLNYLGLVLDTEYEDDSLSVDLSFYSPVQEDHMHVQGAVIEENQLRLTIFDSLRSRGSEVNFSLSDHQITGISKSVRGSNTLYKNWNLSRQRMHNDTDLEAVDSLMQSFQSNIEKKGYVKAAQKHYKQYSKLIGSTYKPEEMYLNAEGYNLLREGKMDKALDFFELAMVVYPQSANTYDSYGETLVKAGQKEKALKIYKKGYKRAKKTGYKNLPYIEARYKNLQQELK